MIDKTKVFFGFNNKPIAENFPIQNNLLLNESKELEYVWAKDLAMIKQYSRIIDEQFDSELNLKDIYKKINTNDFKSFYRVAMYNGRVVAGVRLTLASNLMPYSLPTERLGFTFNELFPELDLTNNKYCEVTRFASLPEFRNRSSHYTDGYKSYLEKMTEHGVKYLFICSSRARFRIYNTEAKKYFKVLNIKHHDVSEWNDYKNLEFYVCAYENPEVN